MLALIASTRPSMVRSRKAWWPVKASSSTVILARMLRRASCASTFGFRSPAISAASMFRPDTPKMLAMTALSLMLGLADV